MQAGQPAGRQENHDRLVRQPVCPSVNARGSVYIAGRNTTDDASVSVEGGKKSGSMDEEGDSNYYLQFASKGNKHLKTTVIICCPNTTYYEFMYYEVSHSWA